MNDNVKWTIIQGQRIEVRGVQNVPRHVKVPFQKCEDPDTVANPNRVKYPNGLICAGDTGNMILKLRIIQCLISLCQLQGDDLSNIIIQPFCRKRLLPGRLRGPTDEACDRTRKRTIL